MLDNFPIKSLNKALWPTPLLEIPEPPKQLFIRGTIPDTSLIYLCVVGTRKYTPYGKEVCKKLIAGLRGYNVVIVSGLALGIDSIAHEAALDAGLKTIAIPGSGLGESVLYPKSNLGLAKRILETGGALISELEENESAATWTFPQRNRIMAGICKATLVIEAEVKSGTLITSRLATEYNRDVLTVPHSIFSSTGDGPLLLMRLGATPVGDSIDVLEALGLATKESNQQKQQNLFNDLNEDEATLCVLLSTPRTRDELLESLTWGTSKFNTILTMLEIKGVIKEVGGKVYLV
jgi:DNA processing protein